MSEASVAAAVERVAGKTDKEDDDSFEVVVALDIVAA